MSGLLQNKVALITGGSRGIGFGIAKAFLCEEARVIICARDQGRLESACRELRKSGDVLALVCDVSNLDSVTQMIRTIIDQYGRIDILVNNAAIGMTFGRTGEIDPRAWDAVIQVNLMGTFHCCHAVIPEMLRQKTGQIINLTGYGARLPSPRLTAYGASKAAVRAFTKSLSREYRQTGMNINLLSPGVVKTDLLLNRVSTEEGADELKKAEWIFDLLAGPVGPVGELAVKIAANKTGGVRGKEFRVMSRRKTLFRFLWGGAKRFLRNL